MTPWIDLIIGIAVLIILRDVWRTCRDARRAFRFNREMLARLERAAGQQAQPELPPEAPALPDLYAKGGDPEANLGQDWGPGVARSDADTVERFLEEL